jgi:hypothetical protein
MRLRYVCMSKTCRKEMEIETSGNCKDREAAAAQTCTCGAKMKMVYSTPHLFKLVKTESVVPTRNGTKIPK